MTHETEPSHDLMLQRRLRAYELALDTARRDAVQAAQTLAKLSARIGELELELSHAREQPAKLQLRLAEQERATRAAEQRAYAEQALREELQNDLAALDREDAPVAPAGVAIDREYELEIEVELARLRRLADESEHVIAASRSARERAEQRVVELTAQVEQLTVQTAELHSKVREPAAAESRPGPGSARLGQVLSALRAELETLHRLTEHETAARERAERRVAELEDELREQTVRTASTATAIAELRQEIARLAAPIGGGSVAQPRQPLTVAPELARRPSGSSPEEAAGTGAIEPGRFEAALARLREATNEALEREAALLAPPSASIEQTLAEIGVDAERAAAAVAAPPASPEFSPEEEAELTAELDRAWSSDGDEAVAPTPGTLPWIGAAMRRIGEPETAGGLLLELLLAQRTVHPEPIAYDIHLTGMPCLQMTIDEAGQRLVSAPERRPAGQVRFAITGDLASFGRLMVAGRLKRRLSRTVAVVEGDRSGLAALDAIMQARLTIPQLGRLGLRIEPMVTLKLAAAMIQPAWTAGSRFTIAFADPAAPHEAGQELPALVVQDGARVIVGSIASPEATVSCDPDDLPAVLAGDTALGFEQHGEREPLVRLQRWLNRAQSG